MTEKYLSVVGDPIAQSLSPKIHNIAYEFLDLDWKYDRNLVKVGELKSFIGTNEQYSAYSVTMPLKFEAAGLSVSSNEAAIKTGVVNTLVRSADNWLGFNTDVFGITQALSGIDENQIETVAILGSGATGRSAALAVRKSFPKSTVKLFTRSPMDLLNVEIYRQNEISIHPSDDFEAKETLVINTIPEDLTVSSVSSKWWLNVNYTKKIELPAQVAMISGLEMLLWQAIAQIRIFVLGSEIEPLANEDHLVSKLRTALELP